MSQQTQLIRVVPAFERFMIRFPTPAALAEAGLAELLMLWDGLGYQRRAVNLRRAAAIVAAEGWPTSAAELERLPGVGPYTAAAVACFAFGESVAAIDTNVKRVISRWDGAALAGRGLAARAGELLDRRHPAEWTQAIMDLAATICRPTSPQCDACPVSDGCSDPAIYVPPPRQSRYEGSVRQARAAILKRLAAGAVSTHDLAGIPAAQHLEPALAALQQEGLIHVRGETVELTG
jgi:A/G-specific adenine glycosylase